MKNKKKIITMIIILMLVLTFSTIVNASEGLTISDGVRSGNVVTFKITLPKEAGLLGDVNSDGKVNSDDAILLQDWILGKNPKNVNSLLADCNHDERLDSYDEVILKQLITKEKDIITLNGTASKDCTWSYSKNSDGTYDVKVTVLNSANGTIGITVTEDIFKYKDKTLNKKISSKLVTVSPEDKYDTSIKISDGEILKGNKVSFKIESPKGTVLLGDVNSDGIVDVKDGTILQDWILGKDTQKLNNAAADCINDGIINIYDLTELRKILSDTTKGITLNGSLAKDSTYELVKNSDGSFSIVVTLPETTKLGTIGVTLEENKLKTEAKKVNKKLSSSLLDLSNKSEEFKVVEVKQEDKDNGSNKKVTVIVNQELDPNQIPEGWKLSEGGKSISKDIPAGKEEKITLVAKDGSKIDYTVKTEKSEEKDKTEEFKVVGTDNEKQDNGKVKVTIKVNKELDQNQIPEGWKLSEDRKSISKIMNQGKEEKVTLVAKDGSKIDYTIKVKSYEEEKKENKKDNTQAPTKIPQTGATNTIIFIILAISLVGVVLFIKSRNIKK